MMLVSVRRRKDAITGWLWNSLNAIVVCVNSETKMWKKKPNYDNFYACVHFYNRCTTSYAKNIQDCVVVGIHFYTSALPSNPNPRVHWEASSLFFLLHIDRVIEFMIFMNCTWYILSPLWLVTSVAQWWQWILLVSIIGQILRWGVGTIVRKLSASLVRRATSAGKGRARIIWVVRARIAVDAGMSFTWGDCAASPPWASTASTSKHWLECTLQPE